MAWTRADGIIPFGVEGVAGDVDGFHLGVGDLDTLFVDARVERTLYAQSGFGRGRRDQFHDGESVGERSAAPGLCDVADMRCSILFHFDVPGG